MSHIGIVSPAMTGHLNPMMSLGRELKRRGHRVSVLSTIDAEVRAVRLGLEFSRIGEIEFPKGIGNGLVKLGKLTGLSALRDTSRLFSRLSAGLFRDGPDVLTRTAIDALLVDQTLRGAGLCLAEHVGVPSIEVCSAMIMNPESAVPPFFTGWRHRTDWWARYRNYAGNLSLAWTAGPLFKLVTAQRAEWRLPATPAFPLATLCQQPPELEFPRRYLGDRVHFTGPFARPDDREPVAFPFERLTGRPLVYASLGTLQNCLSSVYQCIVDASEGLDVQLVLSLGGGSLATPLERLRPDTVVVKYAPQLELLERASLTITHAGLNTTLESLACGVPLVAIPIAHDQPGVGVRIAHAGVGEVVALSRVRAGTLRRAMRQVLDRPSYRSNAAEMKEAIRRAGGLSRAADVIETALLTRSPVVSNAQGLLV